ncbi:MAG: T9SS type B sorting domain-containing protein [Flavobacteriales bacterium]|jgi:gliding motility-associated-like protein|nr:T9SS type B sorting domain-containing protein [Flavobacteriales bacterium]MBT5090174.1 T9SS type B sorting domain-containing protein [Flavobacteriales bacterium]
MKKILLIVCAVFFALFSNKTNGQTINNILITDTINCPGGTADIQVNILNPANNTYSVVLQRMNAFTNFNSVYSGQWAINTQALTHSFVNLDPGNYRILLVDTACSPPYNQLFNLPANDPCIFSAMFQPIIEPDPLVLSVFDDTLSCWNSPDALITVNLTGYTQPYTVWLYDAIGNNINGPTLLGQFDTAYTFPTAVSAGTYTIDATGPTSCPVVSVSHDVLAPDTILIDAEITSEISCFGAADGEITITSITGGSIQPSPNYTIFMSGPNGIDTLLLTSFPLIIPDLEPGNYQLTVIDEFGCDTISEEFNFTQPNELSASTTYINPTCDGYNDGSITLTLSSIHQGAGGPFQYTLNGGFVWLSFNNSFVVVPNLPDGVYSNIRVRDVNGCEFNLPNDTLRDLDPVTFSLTAFDYNGFQTSCNGVCDGEITINNMQGGAGAPYSIGGTTIFVDTIRDSLCGSIIGEGGITYFDTIQDAIGCLGFGNITLYEPEIFSISAVPVLKLNNFNVSCPGVCDGDVMVTPGGGVDSIAYSITNMGLFATNITPSTVQATGVCGINTNNGPHTVVAIDANGCIAVDSNIILLEPTLFTYDIDSINENCSLNNGKAWVSNINGGLLPYTYTWTGPVGTVPFTNNDTIENLSYGQYNVTVTDAMGCFFTDSTFVDSSFILVDPINVLVPCNGIDNGEITINTNGVLLSQIVLENLTTNDTLVYYISSYDSSGVLVQNPNIDTIMNFDNLISSNYELRVELYGNTQGSQGCASMSYPITIGDSVSMNATLDVALSQLDLACFGDMTNSIILHVLDGFGGLQSPNNNNFNAYTVNPLGPQNIAISDVATGNNNFLLNGGPLSVGNYNIVVTPNIQDAFGTQLFTNCYDTVAVSVTQPDSMQFTLGTVQTLCYDDSTGIVFVDTIFGGNSGEYNYVWRNSLGNIINNSADLVSDLPVGMYYLSVQDSLSCLPITVDSIEVTSPDSISWITSVTAIDSCEYASPVGSILATSLGGVGAHSYLWEGSDANGNPFSIINQTISSLTSGMYYITITDSNLCWKEDSVFIENGQNPSLDPSSFTNVSCFGAHDGSYIGIVDLLNGSLSFPYTFYDFSLSSFVSGYIPSDSLLGPGDTINIRLKDNFGCVDSIFYVITEPDLLEITHLDTLTYIGGYNVSCNGSLDGELTIHTVGGTLDYTYWLQDISISHPTSTDSVFSGLATNYYQAFVIDDHGCLDSFDIYLSQPDSLLIDSFDIHTYIGGNNISCDGFNDGAAQVNVSGGNQIYSYLWSNGSVTDTAINLNAASYSVTVTDPNGCFAIDSINLTEPTPLIISGFNTAHLLCKGGDRGSSTVNVSGSIPGYTYLWDNANSTTSTYINPNDTVPSMNDTMAFADTLRAGWYNVEVWDMNGCYITDSVELTEPIISITIDSLIVTQMTCFSYNNASVDIIATGPQPIPYSYSVYDESNPANILQGNIGFTPGLSLGNYVALVEDNLGCLDRDTFTINPLDSVYIDTVVFNNVSCNGFNDGYIQNIVPMGGIAPYEYSIDGGPHFSSWLCNTNPNTCPTGYIFSGLAAGIYDVEIWDANGCANSYKITINEPVQMSVSITTNSYNNYQILCNGESDSAFVNVSGGLSPYTLDYASTSLTNNSGIFTSPGLSSGIYIFTITDDNSCTYMESVAFNEPNPITINPIITDVFCDGLCTGEITAIVNGGVGLGNGSNYSYQWYTGNTTTSPLIGQTSYNINNLCIGDYTIQATDANGCTGLLTPTIGADVLQINITNSVITNLNCFEDCDGSVNINVSGGVPASSGSAYTYLWDDILSQTNQTAIGLCQGLYNCTVTDMAGCIVTNSIPFIVTQPDEFDANIILSSAIECNGGTGDLTIMTTGGSNPIGSYEWSDGTTTNTLNNVISGNYTCFVEDNNGCTDTAHYNLAEPSILTILESDIVVSDVKCKGGSTGEIQIMGSGGTPIPGIPGKYNYKLFDVNNILVATITNQLVAVFTGLSTGIYFIEVTDNNNCSYTTSNLFIGQPDNDLEITIDFYDETCLLNDAYAVVYPIGGTPTYSFDWDNNGASSNAQQILLAGENTPHTVIVTDFNGCEVSETITLLGYKNVFLPNNNDYYNASICLGETINIDIDGKLGLTYVWTMSNGAVVATTADLTLMTDSSFSPIEILTLTITDPDCGGSHSVIATVNIDDLDPQCSADKLTILLDQSVTLSEIGPVNFDTYEWTNTNGDLLSSNSSFTDSPKKSDWYNLYVTNGICKGYCSIYITLGVLPFDAISPNGDGMNDEWVIQDLERYPDAIVKVFNRWGQLLLESDGPSYPNNDFNWEELTVGTYYYIIDLGNGDLPQTGPITIIK